MKKINFVNNDAPYLSAENLNQMQDNIEEAIGDTYSTKETFTGKYWIDGKKIYRKVIITEGIVGNNSLISHNISDLKMCVDRSIFANAGKTTYMEGNPIFMLALNKIDETNIDINISDAFSTWKIHFTLEYTKTTD